MMENKFENLELNGTESPKSSKDERFVEEVEKLIQTGVVKNIRQFLISIGAHEAMMNSIRSGRQGVSDLVIDNTSNLYARFDKYYVYTGLRQDSNDLPMAKEAETNYGGLGQRMRAARQKQGFTQAELGEKLGRSRKSINEWETGDRIPAESYLLQLAEILNVSKIWLQTGEGNMNQSKSELKIMGKLSELELIYLPQIDAKAAANYSSNIYQDLYKLATYKEYPVIKIPGIDYHEAFVLDIEGDSMYPTFRPGTKVIARLVPEGRWSYVTGVHAISLKENMFTIKRIIRNQNNILTLKADNPRFMDEVNIQLADILCMFKIGEVVFAPAE